MCPFHFDHLYSELVLEILVVVGFANYFPIGTNKNRFLSRRTGTRLLASNFNSRLTATDKERPRDKSDQTNFTPTYKRRWIIWGASSATALTCHVVSDSLHTFTHTDAQQPKTHWHGTVIESNAPIAQVSRDISEETNRMMRRRRIRRIVRQGKAMRALCAAATAKPL